MLEEQLEREEIHRCRVERLVAAREREKILSAERRTQYEAKCAKMEEMAKESARRKQEEIDKAAAELEHIKQVISDQFERAAERNAKREEEAKIQAKIYMDIAAEDQKRLAKVRGEMATEKAKEVYKASSQGIRQVQNQRRMEVRREESRKSREEAALNRKRCKSQENKSQEEKLAAVANINEMDAAGVPVNKCLHSNMHIMECKCCQPPASWGVMKSIPLAWALTGYSRKDRPLRVLPIQEKLRDDNSKGDKHIEGKKSWRKSKTRNLMRRDKFRAKKQAKEAKERREKGITGEREVTRTCKRTSEASALNDSTSDKETKPVNQTLTFKRGPKTYETRRLIRRDKLRAKKRNSEKITGPSSTVHVLSQPAIRVPIVSTEEGKRQKSNPSPDRAEKLVGSPIYDAKAALEEEKDILDEVVRELMALDDMYDPQLERLMKERQQIISRLSSCA